VGHKTTQNNSLLFNTFNTFNTMSKQTQSITGVTFYLSKLILSINNGGRHILFIYTIYEWRHQQNVLTIIKKWHWQL